MYAYHNRVINHTHPNGAHLMRRLKCLLFLDLVVFNLSGTRLIIAVSRIVSLPLTWGNLNAPLSAVRLSPINSFHRSLLHFTSNGHIKSQFCLRLWHLYYLLIIPRDLLLSVGMTTWAVPVGEVVPATTWDRISAWSWADDYPPLMMSQMQLISSFFTWNFFYLLQS